MMLAYMSDSGKYVDWQSFKAHFDNAEFVEMLAYGQGTELMMDMMFQLMISFVKHCQAEIISYMT